MQLHLKGISFATDNVMILRSHSGLQRGFKYGLFPQNAIEYPNIKTILWSLFNSKEHFHKTSGIP